MKYDKAKADAEYWEWLNGGRERNARKLERGRKQVMWLWIAAAFFLTLSLVLHIISIIGHLT